MARVGPRAPASKYGPALFVLNERISARRTTAKPTIVSLVAASAANEPAGSFDELGIEVWPLPVQEVPDERRAAVDACGDLDDGMPPVWSSTTCASPRGESPVAEVPPLRSHQLEDGPPRDAELRGDGLLRSSPTRTAPPPPTRSADPGGRSSGHAGKVRAVSVSARNDIDGPQGFARFEAFLLFE